MTAGAHDDDGHARKLETRAVHAGRAVDSATGAVTPPLHLSTTFERDADGSWSRGYDYARSSNPTRRLLETALADLEAGRCCAAFASGSAATLAVLQSVGAGCHIVATGDSYYGTLQQIRELLPALGIETTMTDTTSPDAVRSAMRKNTRLIWVETPSNPLLRITDIAAMAEIARAAGCKLACDNTFATPVFQNPLQLGADYCVHSTTKYISGHGDVVGGAVIADCEEDAFQAIRRWQVKGGAVPSSFDCWLLLRSLNTLPLRVRQQSANALQIASFLSEQAGVEAVHYPGLPHHPGHALAQRQMQVDGQGGFGSVVSFEVPGGARQALAVAARTRLFIRATSLGGVESLIEHRASSEGPGSKAPPGMLRLAVGIENSIDLIADLQRALNENR